MNVWVYAQNNESFGETGDEYESRDAAIASAILDPEITGSYVTGKLEESYPVDYDALAEEIFLDVDDDDSGYLDTAKEKHKELYEILKIKLKESIEGFIKALTLVGHKLNHTIVVEIEEHTKS